MKQDHIKVCLASLHFYPTFTGSGTRFQFYIPGFQAKGIDFSVFTGIPETSEYSSGGGAKFGTKLPVEHLEDLQIHRVELPAKNKRRKHMTFVRSLLDYCRHPATRPDLIQSLSLSIWWLPWWFSLRRLGIPIVHTYTLVGELSPKLWKRRLQPFYWRLPFQMADCVVTSSGVARDALRKIGVTKRIEVIPNGVDLTRFKPIASTEAQQAVREQLGLDPAGEFILFVGSLIERKGVDVLVEAWGLIARKRPRAYLLLVGPTNKDMRNEMLAPDFQAGIETTIARSGAADRVIITGRVANIEAYYQAADVFVFPSRREGMGNVVLEAFGCGLATILTPFVGIPDEFGRPGEQYILVERTPETLAKATIAMLENPTRRKQLALQSRQWVEAHLDVEKSIEGYATLYRELVSFSTSNSKIAPRVSSSVIGR